MWTLWQEDESEGKRSKNIYEKCRGPQPSDKEGLSVELCSTFYLSKFPLVGLFQANWSNLETSDDEKDLHEEQNHRKCTARPLQACTFGTQNQKYQ